jgi:hypothetical protein
MTTSTATLYRYDHYEASYGYDTEFHPTIDDAIKSHGVDSALLVDRALPEHATYHQITVFTVAGEVPAGATQDEFMELWESGEIVETICYMDAADVRPEFLRVNISDTDATLLTPLYNRGGAAYLDINGPQRVMRLHEQDKNMTGMRSAYVDSGRALRIPIPNDRTGATYNAMMTAVAIEVVRLLDSYEEVQTSQRTEGKWDEELLQVVTDAVEGWFPDHQKYTIIKYTLIDDADEWLSPATTVDDGVISILDIEETLTAESTDEEIEEMAGAICESEMEERNIIDRDDVVAYLRARIADLTSDNEE